MNKRSILLVIATIITIVTVVASPVFSYGSYSGNQQYGTCTCHGTTSSVTVTMQSSPSASVALSTGQTVSVWVNVTGSIGGTVPLGALIASNQASSASLPTQNGWTILSDPSGTSSKYNYYKTDSYSGSRSFKWTLSAPTTAGSFPLYARILHAGANEFTKSADPLNFNVQAAAVSPPIIHISSPTNGATVSGTMTVSVTVTPGSGETISYVNLKVDGVHVGNDTSPPYSFGVSTTSYSNGPHTLNVTAADTAGRKGYDQISVSVNNVPSANPTVVITSPTNGQTVTGNVAVSVNVTNASAIGYVLLRIDGTDYSNRSSPPYDWTVDTNLFLDGHRLVNATAADVYGRRAYAEVAVIVDNAPSVTITAPVAGANYQGIITVSATVAGGANISFAQLWVNGTLVSNITAEPYSWDIDTADYGDGPMTINVTAKDMVGRHAYQEISIVIDNPGQDEPLDRFIGTIIAGTIGLAALITASVVAVLFLKGKRPGGK